MSGESNHSLMFGNAFLVVLSLVPRGLSMRLCIVLYS